jgi:hypothetical protein
MSRLFLDLFIQGAVSALALYLLGVPYALALGAWVSLAALILYFGSVLGAVPAVIMAFTVSGVHRLAADGSPDDHRILHHSAGEGQQPHARIHGHALHIHPIPIVLAVIVGWGLFMHHGDGSGRTGSGGRASFLRLL